MRMINRVISLPPCTEHHYWIRLQAWVTRRQYFHACDVTSTSVTGKNVLLILPDDYPPTGVYGGDITILPDLDFNDEEAEGLEALQQASAEVWNADD